MASSVTRSTDSWTSMIPCARSPRAATARSGSRSRPGRPRSRGGGSAGSRSGSGRTGRGRTRPRRGWRPGGRGRPSRARRCCTSWRAASRGSGRSRGSPCGVDDLLGDRVAAVERGDRRRRVEGAGRLRPEQALRQAGLGVVVDEQDTLPDLASVPARWWQVEVFPTPPFWFSRTSETAGMALSFRRGRCEARRPAPADEGPRDRCPSPGRTGHAHDYRRRRPTVRLHDSFPGKDAAVRPVREGTVMTTATRPARARGSGRTSEDLPREGPAAGFRNRRARRSWSGCGRTR